jgi:hypothetical protein
MDVSIPAIKVRCFGVGFGEGGCSDSFDGGVMVGGLSGFGVRRPDCACPRQQTIKTKRTLSEIFKNNLMNLVLNSFSPLRNFSLSTFLKYITCLMRARRL